VLNYKFTFNAKVNKILLISTKLLFLIKNGEKKADKISSGIFLIKNTSFLKNMVKNGHTKKLLQAKVQTCF
jgi:hypothetical protein